MATVVRVLLYSGRQNPSWELSTEQRKAVGDLLKRDRTVTPENSAACFGKLGYSGFLLESPADPSLPDNAHVLNGIININDSFYPNFVDQNAELELLLLETAGSALTEEEESYIRAEIGTNLDRGINWVAERFRTVTVPPFNPIKWNNRDVMPKNNCYNYANDKITNTFAQPGKASGQELVEITCQGVIAASIADGQIRVEKSAIEEPPPVGHFVCLVMWPGRDYHWYRLDRTGIWSERKMWSHKPGQTWAKNWDASGQPIWDPEKCDYSPYTEFCGYFMCDPANTTIR